MQNVLNGLDNNMERACWKRKLFHTCQNGNTPCAVVRFLYRWSFVRYFTYYAEDCQTGVFGIHWTITYVSETLSAITNSEATSQVITVAITEEHDIGGWKTGTLDHWNQQGLNQLLSIGKRNRLMEFHFPDDIVAGQLEVAHRASVACRR